jgi:hypothetical protein
MVGRWGEIYEADKNGGRSGAGMVDNGSDDKEFTIVKFMLGLIGPCKIPCLVPDLIAAAHLK